MSNISTDQMLVTESDLEAAMDKIETIPFHEEKEVGGIKFWCYNAGHAGVKILHDYELCVCPNDKCGVYMFQLADINNFTRSRTVVSVDKIEYEREDILVILIPTGRNQVLVTPILQGVISLAVRFLANLQSGDLLCILVST